MQKVILIGHVGNDAKVVSNSGNDFISFSVACTERFKKQGVDTEHTQWYNCTYSPNNFEIANYIKKGTQVYIEGKPTFNLFNSQKGTSIDAKVFVQSLQLVGSKKDAEETGE